MDRNVFKLFGAITCLDDGIFYKIDITFEYRETEDWFSKELLKRGIPLHRDK